jgi:hypothetical protein
MNVDEGKKVEIGLLYSVLLNFVTGVNSDNGGTMFMQTFAESPILFRP